MQAVKIAENIYWVGAVDFKLRNFHGYLTPRGSSYNAYLVIDEKITLIDGVKAPFTAEMLERISSVIDPERIDTVICNHVEPDHSGAIPAVCKLNPQIKVYASFPAGISGMKSYYGDLNYVPVKSGDKLSLGKYTLSFLQTPMIHWPDNMVSYLEEEHILFSNDAFGQHYASYERFDGETDINVILYEAQKYYANIVLPYSAQVKKAVAALANLKIDVIAPSHGIILREHISEILALYKKLYDSETEDVCLLVYDTMWGSTQKMADAIADVFLEKGIRVKRFDLQNCHESDIITEFCTAKYLAFGSSTLNNNMLATMGKCLNYIRGLSYGSKQFVAFGSYGWSGQSPKQIYDELLAMKHVPICEPIRAQYRPDTAAIKQQLKLKLN